MTRMRVKYYSRWSLKNKMGTVMFHDKSFFCKVKLRTILFRSQIVEGNGGILYVVVNRLSTIKSYLTF
jgi:hypothetical protein